MRFPIEWLKEYTTKFPEELEKLTDKLSMTGFMLDKPIEEAEGMKVMDLEFRRNRPDAEGMIGMAREVVAAFGGDVQLPETADIGSAQGMSDCKLEIEAEDLVNRFYALQLKVSPGDTPKEIAERLTAYGMEASGNSVIDITNYVMLETGQPLHAFDLSRLDGVLKLRTAKNGEKLNVLGGQSVELEGSDLIIAGKDNPLAVAGVIGGEGTGVKDETTEIVLEAANYDRVSIRLTSRRHNLPTEAADRLQKDRDPNAAEFALKRAVYLLKKHADAEFVGGEDYYPNPTVSWTVDFDPKEIERYGGVKVPAEEAEGILRRLGMKIEKADTVWKVIVPTFRTDVRQAVDIVEEVLRIWGYEKIPEINMATPIPDPIHVLEYELEEEIRDLLTSMGLDELITIAALPMEALKDSYKDPEHKELERAVKIESPPTEYFEYLRTNMFPTLLENVKTKVNLGGKNPEVFEVGRIYFKDESIKDDVPYRELRRAAGVLTGKKDWYDAKGIVSTLLNEIGVEFEWKEGGHPVFLDDTILEAEAGNKTVAWIGALDNQFCGFEIDVDELAKCDRKTKDMSRWSEYPQVHRDISVIVNQETKSKQIIEAIEESGGDILYDVKPADIYTEEENLKKRGRKNIVYSLTYWSKEKTLTAEEVDAIHKKIGEALEKKLGAEIPGLYEIEVGKASSREALDRDVMVGKILKVDEHPNADKLTVVTVDVGGDYPEYRSGKKVIICGAPNIKPGTEGSLVPVALPGAKIKMAVDKNRTKFEECEVKEVEIRGVKSSGMLCSQKELDAGEEDEGIWILDKGEYSVGEAL